MSAPVTSLQLTNYPVGTYQGAAVPWQSGLLNCAIVPTMDTITGADTTKSATFGFQISTDGGNNWSTVSTTGWQGGPNTKLNTPYNFPGISPLAYQSGQTPPTHVRALWTSLTGAVSVGLSLQFS